MITVIIPSYNRAHLLHKTIPTYLQKGVSRILVIDDASTDNTKEVVFELQREIKELDYIRLAKNSKQVFAKNVGINLTKTDWIYFGDDDSILLDNSIEKLLETCVINNAEICGCKALYMERDGDVNLFVERNDILIQSNQDIANIRNLTARFQYSVSSPIEVSFTHASALVRTKLAKEIKFDTHYFGNCYREETDFFIRCKLSGAKLYFNSKAVQVNLPRSIAKGGSHSSGKLKWYYYSIVNNHYFIKKNWKEIESHFANVQSGLIVEGLFIGKLFLAGVSNLLRKIIKR